MSSKAVKSFNLEVGPITCHAWNKDRKQLAVASSGNCIYIFEFTAGKWTKKDVLEEHDMQITGIDWAPRTDRIVSCSQDKNAFVWTRDGSTWKPELVLVRINKAATCVKWSPAENKFAVASGAKLISVCYYEEENDWWVARQIKKPIKSTVTCISWHPNSVLLAAGSCDFKVRIFSAYVKEVDGKVLGTSWGSKLAFGTPMAELYTGAGGWIHSLRFSPGGDRLAWVGHDSSVSLLDSADQENNGSLFDELDKRSNIPLRNSHVSISTVRNNSLPFNALEWITENSLVAAGHNCCPVLFTYDKAKNGLEMISKLDIPSEDGNNALTAMNKFRNLDKVAAVNVGTTVSTLHQNSITDLGSYSFNTNKSVKELSTCGLDGLLAIWDLKGLEAAVDVIEIK